MHKLIIYLLTITVLLGVNCLWQSDSPETSCPMSCSLLVNNITCNKDEILLEKSICNCLPTCVKRRYGEICENESEWCGPGLKCIKHVYGDEDAGQYYYACDVDKSQCRHYDYLTRENNYINELVWRPQCAPDGSYAPVQCKGERYDTIGRCYCYDRDGNRIFGEEWWFAADNMTCACSRKVEQLKKLNRTDITLHCAPNGNYEPLQCDSGFCWCADPMTGRVIGEIVVHELMGNLECAQNTMGSGYFRKCESERIATNNLLEEFKVHGTTALEVMSMPVCDPDGSYARQQYKANEVICTEMNGEPIKAYVSMRDSNDGHDCNCARDFVVYENFTHLQSCQPSGSYSRLQFLNDKNYCIDSDGFPIMKAQTESLRVENCTDWIYWKAE